MKWTREAEEAVKKVPFFVRKKVRRRIEQQVRLAGKQTITLVDVQTARKRFLAGMEKEIKGWQLETCFGAGGCPNRITDSEPLLKLLEATLESADLLQFLKASVNGPLKFHHEFRVALAECPNACSQPQIKDMGIIAARCPLHGKTPCSACGACADVCKEKALILENGELVKLLTGRCVSCGQCLAVCPTGTLEEEKSGWRIQLGGKLGRHPRLAREMPGIYTAEQVVTVLKKCLEFYKAKSRNGQRLGEILTENEIADLVRAVHQD